jgi:hypothetical protein
MLVEVTEGLMALGRRKWQAAPQRSASSRLLTKHCFLVRTVMGISLEAVNGWFRRIFLYSEILGSSSFTKPVENRG